MSESNSFILLCGPIQCYCGVTLVCSGEKMSGWFLRNALVNLRQCNKNFIVIAIFGCIVKESINNRYCSIFDWITCLFNCKCFFQCVLWIQWPNSFCFLRWSVN